MKFRSSDLSYARHSIDEAVKVGGAPEARIGDTDVPLR